MRRLVAYLWSAPVTLAGLIVGYLCVAFGGTRVICRDGVLEFYGGALARLLDAVGVPGLGAMPAMTMGHVLWARNRRELRRWRRHELVHVKQFERWGILFVPAYYLAAIWLRLHGRHPYYDNPFEREAYGKVPYPHAVDGLARPVEALAAYRRPVAGLRPMSAQRG